MARSADFGVFVNNRPSLGRYSSHNWLTTVSTIDDHEGTTIYTRKPNFIWMVMLGAFDTESAGVCGSNKAPNSMRIWLIF